VSDVVNLQWLCAADKKMREEPPVTDASGTRVLWEEAIDRTSRNMDRFGDRFPTTGEDGRYRLIPNENWLAGFWTGILWLAYASAHAPRFRETAESLLPSFRQRLDERINLTHDLGFLYTLSAVAQWRLTGDPFARDLALRAADLLRARFRPAYQALQAWDGEENAGRIIIDSMMNLPLLYWASHETGDPGYQDVAARHAETTRRYLLRPDGSTNHTYLFDPGSGRPAGAKTHQGWSDGSLWSRGQAWAIYGFAIAAEALGDRRFLEAAQLAADRLLAESPADSVPYWDLRIPAAAPQWRDSSAGAIAAAALLRLGRVAGKEQYQSAGRVLIHSLTTTCAASERTGEAMLTHGALHVPKGWATDNYLIFGDYFWLESLCSTLGFSVDLWGSSSTGKSGGRQSSRER
jgi:unsaturated chondroitin disaccharide hydrolase